MYITPDLTAAQKSAFLAWYTPALDCDWEEDQYADDLFSITCLIETDEEYDKVIAYFA